jgi:hypothetical protein
MIPEDGTVEQMKEAVVEAWRPQVGDRWQVAGTVFTITYHWKAQMKANDLLESDLTMDDWIKEAINYGFKLLPR